MEQQDHQSTVEEYILIPTNEVKLQSELQANWPHVSVKHFTIVLWLNNLSSKPAGPAAVKG